MVAFLVARPEAGEIVQFVLRELSHPTAALDRIYAGVFEPTHKRLCRIWEEATGEPAESDADQDHRLHADRPGRLFPHRPRGGDAAHGLERHRAEARRRKSSTWSKDNLAAILTARKGGRAMSFLCAIPLVASLFAACAPPPPLAVGYVEGEYRAAGADRGGAGARPFWSGAATA